ncbi:MAG TPA: methyltransferase domain-containing protein [Dehalococcoidia bacterium]|nr:methyltransferase domain-containing protein [Dehalococcoidia bacterium]
MLPLDRQHALRDRYARLAPHYRHSGLVYEEMFAEVIRPASDVLDAGGGRSGVIGKYRASLGRAVCLDVDHPSLRDNRTGAGLVCGRLEALPFSTAQFDVILCTWVVEHLADPDRAFAELSRVLRPGGYLLILTPSTRNYLIWLNRLFPSGLRPTLVRWFYAREEEDTFPAYYRANTRAALDQALARVGLVPDRVEHIGDPTYLGMSPLLFWPAVAYERLTDLPQLREGKVHLVARFAKRP